MEDAGPFHLCCCCAHTQTAVLISVGLCCFAAHALVLAALLCCIEVSHTEKSQIISVEQSDFLKAKQGLGQ